MLFNGLYSLHLVNLFEQQLITLLWNKFAYLFFSNSNAFQQNVLHATFNF